MKYSKWGGLALKALGIVSFFAALAIAVATMPSAAPVSAEVSEAVAIPAAVRDAEPKAVPRGGKLIPLGRTTGIKLFSEGAMVVGFAELTAAGGRSPAQAGGLEMGDVIVAVNNQAVTSNESLQAALAQLEAGRAVITAKRGGEAVDYAVDAVHDGEGWRIGAWVRDSIAGIGTITFVDPGNGAFGALGHGISDADTGQRMGLDSGAIMDSTVSGVKRGEAGNPGELSGQFDLTQDQGVLYANTDRGIFGRITEEEVYAGYDALDIGGKDEIRVGPAYILSNVEGRDTRRYDIEVVRVYPGDDGSGRDMMIRVTDAGLIAITGGIVQGMSGSPIIQGGKIIGAVTHVLVNDPLRGYGIGIERMLAEAVRM